MFQKDIGKLFILRITNFILSKKKKSRISYIDSNFHEINILKKMKYQVFYDLEVPEHGGTEHEDPINFLEWAHQR